MVVMPIVLALVPPDRRGADGSLPVTLHTRAKLAAFEGSRVAMVNYVGQIPTPFFWCTSQHAWS